MRFRIQKKPTMSEIVALLDHLDPVDQVCVWRGLGEGLLAADNPLDVMIAGMPLLERAVYTAASGFLRPRKTEEQEV